MRKPCNKCEFSNTYKTVKKTNYYPNRLSGTCAVCEKYLKYQDWLESKRKYHKGEKIRSIKEFEEHISDEFMYWNDKVQHVGWLMSMQYVRIRMAISLGILYTAIRKAEK